MEISDTPLFYFFWKIVLSAVSDRNLILAFAFSAI